MSDLPKRLRVTTLEVRRQKMPLGNLIPMMQQAADRIEADEALMRQALEALRRLDGWLEVRHLGGLMPDEKALTAELGARLETSNV